MIHDPSVSSRSAEHVTPRRIQTTNPGGTRSYLWYYPTSSKWYRSWLIHVYTWLTLIVLEVGLNRVENAYFIVVCIQRKSLLKALIIFFYNIGLFVAKCMWLEFTKIEMFNAPVSLRFNYRDTAKTCWYDGGVNRWIRGGVCRCVWGKWHVCRGNGQIRDRCVFRVYLAARGLLHLIYVIKKNLRKRGILAPPAICILIFTWPPTFKALFK